MPVDYLRTLTAPERTRRTNIHLGTSLAFIAGATNAGGFLAVGQYTSHMTGMVSSFADALVMGDTSLLKACVVAMVAFISGAATCAIMINWARRQKSRHEYSMPLLVEALLLLAFGLLGDDFNDHGFSATVYWTVALLSFVMGLQNAMITKVSNAEIRTTHVTGMVTDIGIEIGKLLYWNRSSPYPDAPKVEVNWTRLGLHSLLVGSFSIGAMVGAFGFKYVGYGATVPLAIALAVLSSVQFLPASPPKLIE
ncbi:YoaK family protein [Aquabacterium sp.]|uniref:YoaK family protein n=1 Tax=Aquabacterium sp. TaxID=1872578 RepID=UPI002E2F0134|nr:YoaK family protein [Aquabacterium sp.]HEX5312679.1 YoaK family protein [Aquabacterium sp.]